MGTKNHEIDFEKEYRTWLESTLEISGLSKGQVAEEIRKTAKSIAATSKDIEDAKSLSDAAVRNWFSRLSLPSASRPILTKALVLVVEKIHLTRPAPGTLLTFEEAIKGLNAAHFNNSKIGRKLPEISKALTGTESLLQPIAPAREIDEKGLFLGSWVFEGDVPPYCDRDVDEELISRLSDINQNFTFISGAPKAGKTRTLVEALKKSAIADWQTFWISPAAGAIDRVLQQLSGMQVKSLIFVLDDLQKFSFDNINGLNAQKLEELSQYGTVVGTIHTSTVERWQASRTDHRMTGNSAFPGSKSLDLILRNTMNMESKLSDQELAIADARLKNTIADRQEISHLPAWFASVDALIGQARVLQVADLQEQALLWALIDAKVLYPEGTTIELIEYLAKSWFKNKSPHGFWSDSSFESALVAVTTGVTSGAPHSILMPNLDNPDKFSLMDAIWYDIAPERWSTEHLDLDELGCKFVANAAFNEGYYLSAISVLESLGPLIEGDDCLLLGLSSQFSQNLDAALKWYRMGAEYGIRDCAISLIEMEIAGGHFDHAEKNLEEFQELIAFDFYAFKGLIAQIKGEVELAKTLFHSAAQAGSPGGKHNLASLYVGEGRFEDALPLAEQALASGFEPAKYLVATCYMNNGNNDKAEALYKEVSGYPMAASMLARFSYQRLELNQAKKYLDDAEVALSFFVESGIYIEAAYVDAHILIGKALIELGYKNFDEARHLLLQYPRSRVSKERYPEANYANRLLANIEIQQGNFTEGARILESNPDDPDGAFVLASVYVALDKPLQAEAQYRKAAQLGKLGAYLELGNFLARAGRHEEAIEVFRLGAESSEHRSSCIIGEGNCQIALGLNEIAESTFMRLPDEPVAINNAGAAALNMGNQDLAVERYKLAAQLGNRLSMINLCDIYIRKGDLDEAREYASQGAELGDAELIFRLGLIEDNEGNTQGARENYLRAAYLGHAAAANDIAVLYLQSNENDKAVNWFRIASEQGESIASRNLAHHLWEESDSENARKYFEIALAQGNTFSGWMLAEMDDEIGDFASAISRLKPMAKAGYIPAMCALSDMYEKIGKTRESSKWLNVVTKSDRIDELLEYIEELEDWEPERCSKWKLVYENMKALHRD